MLVFRFELTVNFIMNGIIKIFNIVYRSRVSANVSQKANQNPDMHKIVVENRVEFLGTASSNFLL